MATIVEPAQSADTRFGELRRVYYAGDCAAAERLCEEIIVGNPGLIQVLIIWGELALARGDLAEARNRLRRAWQFEFPDLGTLMWQLKLMGRAADWGFLEELRGYLAEQSSRDPDAFGLLFALARVNDLLGRTDEAVSGYERASQIVPANGAVHTFRSSVLLRKAWATPLPAPAEKRQSSDGKGRLAVTALGRMGRFGNQLFQYGYARIYGRAHGLRVEVPDWIGRWLFDLDDPELGSPLLPVEENPGAMGGLLAETAQPILANRDLVGYCQCHTSHLRRHRVFLRALFEPGARLRPIVAGALERLRKRGRTVVAIHLRRGDYGGGELFWPAPASWYLDWLHRTWPELEDPVLYVASDDPRCIRTFKSSWRRICWRFRTAPSRLPPPC
jgi:hypothetical protein